MIREELFAHHTELANKALSIMRAKNNDYCGSKGNSPFANFQRCESMGVCSAEQGFLVRIVDKVSRLSTFANDGKLTVNNESYEDAILDIMNYCVLMSGYVKSKESEQANPS